MQALIYVVGSLWMWSVKVQILKIVEEVQVEMTLWRSWLNSLGWATGCKANADCCVSSPGLPSSLRSSFYYPAPIKAKNFSLYLFFTKKLNKLHHASNKLTVGLKKTYKIGLLTFSELWSMSFKEKRKCWCRLIEKPSYNSMSVSLFTVSRLT